MSCFQVRTDLALEAKETLKDTDEGIRGIEVEEMYDEEKDIRVTKVIVETKNGAKAIQKPVGTYITIEAPRMLEPDDDYHQEIAHAFANELKEIIPDIEKEQEILVAGIGNRDVTADALGPHVVDNLYITRHVVKEYGKVAYNCEKMHMISSIEPGVMAKTGMESAEIIKGVIAETNPNLVIVIDALAARSTKRLNRTIQITDTGIHPGSGVGNHRNALTKESLGVTVIAVGIPTVVDAATIVADVIGDTEHPKAISELNNMYVTSKDIDAVIKRLSFMISEGINEALEFS